MLILVVQVAWLVWQVNHRSTEVAAAPPPGAYAQAGQGVSPQEGGPLPAEEEAPVPAEEFLPDPATGVPPLEMAELARLFVGLENTEEPLDADQARKLQSHLEEYAEIKGRMDRLQGKITALLNPSQWEALMGPEAVRKAPDPAALGPDADKKLLKEVLDALEERASTGESGEEETGQVPQVPEEAAPPIPTGMRLIDFLIQFRTLLNDRKQAPSPAQARQILPLLKGWGEEEDKARELRSKIQGLLTPDQQHALFVSGSGVGVHDQEAVLLALFRFWIEQRSAGKIPPGALRSEMAPPETPEKLPDSGKRPEATGEAGKQSAPKATPPGGAAEGGGPAEESTRTSEPAVEGTSPGGEALPSPAGGAAQKRGGDSTP